MSWWRIRITIPDDPGSLERFTETLAGKPSSVVRLAARGTGRRSQTGTGDITGEVLVELAHDDSLAAVLGVLHGISPQVYVSRAEPDELARQ